jgi:cytidyltransferase-like protein
MTKVVTFGVFDYFHYGHLKLFERAKAMGDYLIVAIQAEDYILKYKPEAQILYSQEQRMELINALEVVDEVTVYTDIDKSIKEIDFDVWAKGEDQNHAGFQAAEKWALEHGKTVKVMTRTPNISTTKIRQQLISD